MGKFHCTVCHDFLGTGPTRKILPGREKCLGCHRNMEVAHEEFSETAPMNFPCGACHAPHAPLPHLPTRRNCMTCHGEKEMASQFKGVFLHSVPAHIDCAACHKPHLWKVAARSACATCHADRGEKHFPGMPCVTCHKVQIGKASETPSGSGPGSVVSRRLAGVHAPARKIALPSVRDRRPPAARTRRGD